MRRLLLWEFPRASWQYDVVVLLLLAFIFLTPREIFRDQPRAANVVLLPSETGADTYWIDEHLLAGLPEGERMARARQILKGKTGARTTLIRLEPMLDSEKELKGFMAYMKP